MRPVCAKPPASAGNPPHIIANQKSVWKIPLNHSRLYAGTRNPPTPMNTSPHHDTSEAP